MSHYKLSGRRAKFDTRASMIRLWWMGWTVEHIADVHRTCSSAVEAVLFTRLPPKPDATQHHAQGITA